MPYQLTMQAIPEVTVVTNEFIDQYMASANGEYVKVYLYLLRHQNELIEVEYCRCFKPHRGRCPAGVVLLGKGRDFIQK